MELGQTFRNLLARPYAAIAAATSIYAVTVLCAWIGWQASDSAVAASRLQHFGESLTAELAAQAVEPVVTQNKIQIAVLANRLVELPEVAGIGIYTIDNVPIATAGRTQDHQEVRQFSSAVTIDDTVAAYVRAGLSRDSFATPASTMFKASWAWWLAGLPFAMAIGCALALKPANDVDPPPSPDAVADPPKQVFVLVVNLFNQISIPPGEKPAALEKVRERAARIANLYAGRAELLSGTGLLLAFDDTRAEDRGFEVLCAALLAARVLQDLGANHHSDERPELVFRFGLHKSPHDAADGTLADRDEVRDAVMLSALAPDGRLAVSAEVFEALPRPDRLASSVVAHPALAGVASTGDRCYIVTAVADSYQALLDRQAELLSG